MEKENELSIEKTNELRKKLGLKELEIEKNEKSDDNKKSVRGRKKKENRNNEREDKAKENDENTQVKTLSEEFKDDIDDVQNWVNKTRNAMNKKLEQESIKYSDEEDDKDQDGMSKKKGKKQTKNSKKNLSNLKVQHKNEDIQNGMVLTLKDKNVLSNEDDCLINEELKKQNVKNLITKNDDNYWNQNYYNPLSYYENDLKNKNEQKDNNTSINMIPKYDDKDHSFDIQINYNDNEKEYEQKSNTKNSINKIKIKNTEDLRKRNFNSTDDKITKSSNVIQMKKRKIKNINKRKSDDVWSFLYKDPTNDEKESEKNNGDKIKKEKNTVTTNNENVNTNSNILQDVMEKIKEENMNMEFNYFDDTLLSQNEEEKELYELLEKGNDLKKKKKERINYQNELLKRIVINDDDKKIDDDKNNNTIKLTDASEFCKSIYLPLDTHENIKKSALKKNDKINGIEIAVSDRTNNSNRLSKLNHNDKDENDKDSIKNDEHDEKKKKKNENIYDDEIDLSENGVSEIFNEIKLDEGLFGALEYLKTRGELNIEDKIYRNPENKPLHMPTDKNEIKIDYKNDTGKVMTPKESFRYISWIFHGKKQGKNKLEKKIKRMEIERRFKENPMESLPTLNVLKKVQEVQKKVYFTLSNNG
ncbi:U4/U6.U5 tri-snRNP-associated protein 1, putative [Plasmodium berghei]|uniref:U4/U6.U5 tri-snRNP-associated protein 1, putative n=2 Tax=Plasmodium berghei TaxID=5821 RepID=A0A509ANC1_PLABA|nr:U4/U6.U5 tri-snRNP-associated protein 1, putative [Plasmodium berghei ANKA]CXI75868.1 U4/U6.U5 tri-snRNP-associated protein 1, putative [Plasmodium berghei]SCM24865.1 U4/U6.U5 tri-snRNP-associated protein 1, putative [Plasmodium berghei]SCN27192.1 U4/U6.U5 tri-snRNP-associated protein 1, putative [Plasmodium berghei]SCO61749.1 U4/U6.U5 tri-snRNP-associated protein 1, putative [Plasmodium berghei]SCO63615.1 U4/U6.U5 tri-snRNP-associated protein 1, putative [Plasmodium berghei]|eukprot:XP_034422826.1 U4/U6.U5 tri-snRNP-associated protein 1, putative [Plasmodium berghei ANKA]